ncbi:MAG: zinc carboxypeptidase, partial [Gammaproteobacteria bacterium]|nr:zinc carboxypeptidase [Gammaproteobacteria bacterium]
MDEEISQPPAVVLAAERGLRDAAQRRALDRHLPEMRQLERLLADAPDGVKLAVQAHVAVRGQDLPIYRVELGSGDPQAPAMLVVGGVHGLERIGTQVVLAFLRSLFERLRWDEALQARLAQVHLI